MEKSAALLLLLLGLLVTVSQMVVASDPDLTTDFDVANPTAANFTFTGFRNPTQLGKGNALPSIASFDMGLPGLSGLGLTAVLFEFGGYSQINPHTHPRATELFFVLSGNWYCTWVVPHRRCSITFVLLTASSVPIAVLVQLFLRCRDKVEAGVESLDHIDNSPNPSQDEINLFLKLLVSLSSS